jgi:hypothetical protein
MRHGKTLTEFGDFLANFGQRGSVIFGGPRVFGNAIEIHDNAGLFQGNGGLGAGEVFVARPQIDQHQMVVSSATDHAVAVLGQRGSEGLGVFDDLLRVGLEFRLEVFAERDGFGGDDVHERSPLHAGEDGFVDLHGDLRIVGHDHPAARAAQGFVRGGRHNVSMWKRRRMHAGGDEPGDVGDVGHQKGAAFVSDGAEFGEVDDARISGVAAEQHLGFAFKADFSNGVVVDVLKVGARVVIDEWIVNRVEPFATHVHFSAVREMAAIGEHQTGERVAGIQHREEDRAVGLRPTVRLDIGEFAAEELLGAFDGQGFDLVVEAAPLVVARVGVPFSVFVGQNGAGGLENGGRDVVLAGNQLERRLLAALFLLDQFENLRVGLL